MGNNLFHGGASAPVPVSRTINLTPEVEKQIYGTTAGQGGVLEIYPATSRKGLSNSSHHSHTVLKRPSAHTHKHSLV